jgi:outer membrane lipoprotein-sorting protein
MIKLSKLLIIICLFSSLLYSQSLDEILEKHFAVVGQANLKDINTIIIETVLYQDKEVVPITVYHKRPLKLRAEINSSEGKSIQIFDGEKGWTLNSGSKSPIAMNEEELEEKKLDADFDGFLYNYKIKGSKLELIGKENVNKSPAFKLKLIRSNGEQMYLFLDAKNFLLVKVIRYRKINGSFRENIIHISDYRDVRGVRFPFQYETSSKDFKLVQQVKSIKFNSTVPDSLFLLSQPN